MTERNGAAAKSTAHDGAIAKTILVVEDNELNMRLFHDLLKANGYNILKAHDGLEGLAMARQHRPDLILMDIQLPDISGLAASKSIKVADVLRSITIIAVTAVAMKGDEDKIPDAGCDAYIAKPISAPSFLKTVKDFLS